MCICYQISAEYNRQFYGACHLLCYVFILSSAPQKHTANIAHTTSEEGKAHIIHKHMVTTFQDTESLLSD